MILDPRPLGATTDGPPIAVRSAADHLVIEVRGHLDRCGTDALAAVLTASLVAATPIRLDLSDPWSSPSPERTSPAAPAADRAASTPRSEAHSAHQPSFDGAHGPPTAILVGGPGLLHLVRPGSCWTLDVAGRRLCRSAARLHPRFVPAEHWTSVSQLWLSGPTLTAVSTCGTVRFSESQSAGCGQHHAARRTSAGSPTGSEA